VGFCRGERAPCRVASQHVCSGGTGDQFYARDRASRAWVALARPSLDVIATFPSFDAMLTKVLSDAVEE
jgi:hypothetical protein